jgi:predicted transcriptional regulator YheO
MKNRELERYAGVAEAISLLLYPHAEVLIHDFATGRISAIYNSFSKRKVGDESLLEEELKVRELPDVFPPYAKVNWDGRPLRSVTATLRDAKNKPIGFLCINLDISKWEEMSRFLTGWLEGIAVSKERPEVLFKDDWQDKINTFVTDYMKQEGLSLKTITREQKKKLVQTLHENGAFLAKNAALYIADVLGISRATIYNYLR